MSFGIVQGMQGSGMASLADAATGQGQQNNGHDQQSLKISEGPAAARAATDKRPTAAHNRSVRPPLATASTTFGYRPLLATTRTIAARSAGVSSPKSAGERGASADKRPPRHHPQIVWGLQGNESPATARAATDKRPTAASAWGADKRPQADPVVRAT